jgi:hypothetical protein
MTEPPNRKTLNEESKQIAESELPFLTLVQAAELLGLRPVTVREQALEGKLRTVRFGKMYMTTRAWVADYQISFRGHPGRPVELPLDERYV